MVFSQLLETLLSERGVGEGERDAFLNPDYGALYDPLLLPDMERARDRILSAMEKGERIMIFSDYDADGIPGAVVLSDFFKRAKYDNVTFYIPHRHDEGFGLNCDAIDKACAEDVKLLMTIDCGVADSTEVEYANKKGIDMIITDHHLPQQVDGREVLPPAFAIVDPKRADSTYPFPELCGAAVAWKLVQAILAKCGEKFGIREGMEKWSLDMVGIATLSDMVPLVGENRILAKFGLEVLRKSPRPGLAALLRRLKINQRFLTEDDVAFMITPRINAASRMGVPMDAFLLLSTTDMREAEELAAHLESINAERKGLVASMVKEAKAHLEKRGELPKVIVIGDPAWRPALLGLVANSLVEEYARPVFVWGRDGDGRLKGSCRGDGTDLFALMCEAGEHFLEYGGHAGAGGFSVETDRIHLLEAALSEAHEHLEAEPSTSVTASNFAIELHDVGGELWEVVSSFAPFGTGNNKPVFRISPAKVKSVKQFGKAKEHLEVLFESSRGQVKAISFFTTPNAYTVPLEAGVAVTLLATLEKSYFMNRPELRLRIVDILAE